MMRKKKYYLCLVAFLLSGSHILLAQLPSGESGITFDKEEAQPLLSEDPDNSVAFTIREIIITGNKKTKANIILREIPFKSGDKFPLQDLVKKFAIARKQLMNTTLFHEVVVAMSKTEGYVVDVLVDVRERWYIFPVPYFKPVDRNLNQWLFEKNASLSRVNYGLKVLHNNATGRNDKFRFFLISGYTKQFSFNYDRLYIDKKLRFGLATSFAIGKNREINYNTINDKQAFLKNDDYLKSFMTASADLTYRRAIKTRHRLGIGYTIENIKDTVAQLNPTYFNEGRKRISFPEIYYRMSYFDLDYIPYPTKGHAVECPFEFEYKIIKSNNI